MGQMITLLIERKRGSLPSNAKVNPRREGKEHLKAITLRSDSTWTTTNDISRD